MKKPKGNFNLDDYQVARDILLQLLSEREDAISPKRLLKKASEYLAGSGRRGGEIKSYLRGALFDLIRTGLFEDVLETRRQGGGRIAALKRMLEEGIEPEEKNAALVSAVINNEVEAVAMLIDAGADVNARESLFNRTPLMYVTGRTNKRIEELLRQAGATV